MDCILKDLDYWWSSIGEGLLPTRLPCLVLTDPGAVLYTFLLKVHPVGNGLPSKHLKKPSLQTGQSKSET